MLKAALQRHRNCTHGASCDEGSMIGSSSPSLRTSHGGTGFRDTGLPVTSPSPLNPGVNGVGCDAIPKYNPKRKRRVLRLPALAIAALRRVGFARMVSGGVSIFLLLSVFSVRI